MIRENPKSPYKGLKRTPMKRKPPKTRTAFPKILRSRELPKLRKRGGLKRISKKMSKQRKEEDKLSLKLAELSGNCCEICKKYNPVFGLHKHEIIKRSHQGNEVDPMNCLLLCNSCHDHRKYPKSGTPLSIEEQLALAKKLHENIT